MKKKKTEEIEEIIYDLINGDEVFYPSGVEDIDDGEEVAIYRFWKKGRIKVNRVIEIEDI